MGNNGAKVDRLGIATDSGLVIVFFGLPSEWARVLLERKWLT